ncbi:autotransporter outer membrane beta-barrel domain-containing protein [Undibacter mobilis]|uniref:Autotransporter outer membrane beta-barrel domain-containing protein n=1 Tax=Undibacter mobilis TaxID=2292256 RepID=A0A371BB37_9BRAD|nr:autotransporter outer membrane beta-barrel domain-containing protein [Undibacter mobilis]RDV04835.1 autotransporter outer membrane beta-barrel domain-containing protein [Undibacter mobilis]
MRLRLAVIAALAATPALAQESTQLANRIGAITDALSQYRSLDNGVWAAAGAGRINDKRPALSRTVTTQSFQAGYDRRFASPFTAQDQLVLGAAVAALSAKAQTDAQNMRVDSRGVSLTGYGVYSPWLFLSFPVSFTVTRWSSDQTRDGTNLMPVYRTSYESTSYASSVGAALTLPVARFLATTSLSHRYSSNNRPAYLEAINPLATDFQFTPSETTDASQLVGNVRLALPFETGRAWVSAGYAHDLKRSPSEGTRSEFPLGIGLDLLSPRWQLGIAGQVILRDDITAYAGALTGRMQF